MHLAASLQRINHRTNRPRKLCSVVVIAVCEVVDHHLPEQKKQLVYLSSGRSTTSGAINNRFEILPDHSRFVLGVEFRIDWWLPQTWSSDHCPHTPSGFPHVGNRKVARPHPIRHVELVIGAMAASPLIAAAIDQHVAHIQFAFDDCLKVLPMPSKRLRDDCEATQVRHEQEILQRTLAQTMSRSSPSASFESQASGQSLKLIQTPPRNLGPNRNTQ